MPLAREHQQGPTKTEQGQAGWLRNHGVVHGKLGSVIYPHAKAHHHKVELIGGVLSEIKPREGGAAVLEIGQEAGYVEIQPRRRWTDGPEADKFIPCEVAQAHRAIARIAVQGDLASAFEVVQGGIK